MKSQGQVRLFKLAAKYGQGTVARKCGVTQPAISMWMTGKRKPAYDNRQTLLKQYGIGLDDWDRPAEARR